MIFCTTFGFKIDIHSHIVLQALHRFTKLLPYMEDANKKTLFDSLRELLYNEQDKDVKVNYD